MNHLHPLQYAEFTLKNSNRFFFTHMASKFHCERSVTTMWNSQNWHWLKRVIWWRRVNIIRVNMKSLVDLHFHSFHRGVKFFPCYRIRSRLESWRMKFFIYAKIIAFLWHVKIFRYFSLDTFFNLSTVILHRSYHVFGGWFFKGNVFSHKKFNNFVYMEINKSQKLFQLFSGKKESPYFKRSFMLNNIYTPHFSGRRYKMYVSRII